MTLKSSLQQAIDRLSIADVTLKTINASLADGFDPDTFPEDSSLSLQTILPTCKTITHYQGEDEANGLFRVVFEMFAGLRVLRGNSEYLKELSPSEFEDQVCATIECTFLVKYDLQQTEGTGGLDDDAVSEFARHNVPFNVWPYWREITQSACGRMGLPKVVLPTHRLRKSATEGQKPITGRASQKVL